MPDLNLRKLAALVERCARADLSDDQTSGVVEVWLGVAGVSVTRVKFHCSTLHGVSGGVAHVAI